jgi:DNA invertase Pin-like site-specific DNA recombinase
LTWALLDDQGEYRLQVESASEPFDTATSMGKALLGMLAVWSQLQADMISESTSAALEARRARGYRLGAQPLALARPEIAQEVQALYSSGRYTHASLAAEMNARGVQPLRSGARWHATTVARVLRQTLSAA